MIYYQITILVLLIYSIYQALVIARLKRNAEARRVGEAFLHEHFRQNNRQRVSTGCKR